MTTDRKFSHIAVLGAGVMGSGITSLAVGHGVSVTLIDVTEATLRRARTDIRGHLRQAQLLGALPDSPQGELSTGTTLSAVRDADAVIEAVTEDTATKAKVLGTVSRLLRPGAPLISNTSGIPIDELAETVPDAGALLGIHFMNPTCLIPLVEVVQGPRTSDAALTEAHDLLTRLRRRTVVVKDAPGFVTSRLLHPMINDAARIVSAGTATPEEVDSLMQGCLGHPTGPLRTADLIGIDNLVDALEALYERTGDERARPCQLLREKVQSGQFGRKTGIGFYEYGEGTSQ